MTGEFPRFDGPLPWLTGEQMREVDRAMVQDYGVALLQMMEHAGRNLAAVARVVFLGGSAAGRRVVVAAGPGGNGGGGLSAARQLHNMGARVTVVLAAPADRLIPEAAHQLATLRASDVRVFEAGESGFEIAGLVIDAIFGYSLRGDPRGEAAALIAQINESGAQVLANDLPSGVEATSGRVGAPAVRASATLTIAMPKSGLAVPAARSLAGDLYLGAIAVPPELYARSFPDMDVPNPFESGEIVRVW